MMQFAVRRACSAILVLWIVMTSVFLLVHVLGDPARATLGAKAQTDQLEAFRQKHGLDRPLPERYVRYLRELVTLDLGTSYQDGQAVVSVLARRLPRTALLGAMALSLELLFGVALGVLAALHKDRWFDTGIMAIALLGISMPTFVTGLWFLGGFAFRLGWFPVGGYGVSGIDHLRHAFLPALTLAVAGAATYARIMRGEMIDTLRSDYVRTARAKGVGPLRVIVVHGVRNALLPIVTLAGMSLRILVSGAIITESIFAWPGMGRLAVEAIAGLDLPIVMGIVFVACGAVQLGNLLSDVAVAWLDPRVVD